MASPTASQGNLGAGQQDPFDSNSDIGVALFLAKQIVNKLETMIPVQVTAVHPGSGSPPAAGTVDVQILVNQLDGQGNAVKPSIVYGLPVYRMQGGPWAIICDPVVNDFGFIIGASRDISGVIKNPGIQNPGSYRKYSYSDAVYLGGIMNKVPDNYIWLNGNGTFTLHTKGGTVIDIDGNGNMGISCNNGSGTLTVVGTLQVTGEVIRGFNTGDQVTLGHHVHAGVTTGPGSTAVPTPGT